MATTHMLSFPNFSETFVVETDANSETFLWTSLWIYRYPEDLTIFVMVDRLSKYIHLGVSRTYFNATQVASLFV